MNERRQSPRLPIAASLEIFRAPGEECLAKGFVTNLSESGLALETVKPLLRGEQLLLRFTVQGMKAVDAVGEIVYSKDGILAKAYGARFINLSPETSSAITGLLAARINH
jgi:hypothetical protein